MENKKQCFWVLKDGDGFYRPMVFISPDDEIGQQRADNYKLEDGDTIELVEFNYIISL